MPEPAWRTWPDGLSAEAVFCFHYPRRASRDATISWGGGDLQLPRRPDGRSWAGASVVLQERLDGSLWVDHRGLCLPVTPAPAGPGELRARKLSRRAAGAADLVRPLPAPSTARPRPPAPRAPVKPGPDHPWRRG